VPLSITLTACATLLAPITTPLLMKLLGGTLVTVDVEAMMWEIIQIVLLPIGVGLVINQALGTRAKYLHVVLPLVSMAGIVIIVGIITAAGSSNLHAVGTSLVACVLLHNVLGFAIGYGAAKLCRLSEQDARTISIEVGMQNGGLATGLAKAMGKVATTGLAPILFATIMNVTGSALAAVWARRPVEALPCTKAMAEPA
jgi:BASS family bile acid:Na+ symporter